MQKNYLLYLLTIFVYSSVCTQLYFPPNNSNDWETIDPSELNWCAEKIDSLNQFLADNNSKAFILLKDGKIVIESYYNGHSATDNWYWASAGKTLTAFLVGIAQQENHLALTDKTSDYLGESWTDLSLDQENDITIWHQLTMTSGMDDATQDPSCTIDTCLRFLAPAGTRWAYHNAPYTLLDEVITAATGQSLNVYTNQKVKTPIGMDGLYINSGFNKVYVSTARSMARFGLLNLNQGNWNGNQIMTDHVYFNQMVNSSQTLNKAYGYLWWLNGKDSFLVPQSQIEFQGKLMQNGPNDVIMALGLNGQFINVVPSENLVWIRMGEAPDNALVPFLLNDAIWEKINQLNCNNVGTSNEGILPQYIIYPNPFNDKIVIENLESYGYAAFELISVFGERIAIGELSHELVFPNLSAGVYYLIIKNKDGVSNHKIVKK